MPKVTEKEIRRNCLQLDAQESIFFARELEHIKTQNVEVEYAEMKARDIVPVSTEADPADSTITYYMFDKVGLAKIISDYAGDLPRVDVSGRAFTSQIRSLGDSFGYSIQELRAARKTGRPLDQRRAATAQEAARRLENRLAFFGDSSYGLVGFLNHPNVTITTIPADGAGSSKLWSTKTADQILRDLHLMANSIVESSLGIEIPDTILLPLEAYNIAATKRIGVDSNMTVLRFFLESTPYIKNVTWLNELATAGAGSTKRIVCYKRDPMKVTQEIPQDFEMFPPQERGLEFVVPAHSRFGGVIFYKPLSANYGDGI